MDIAIVTGSAGLIGSEAARHFAGCGLKVIGIDNDMRREFFGPEASTAWQQQTLERDLGDRYEHVSADIRDQAAIHSLFEQHRRHIRLVVHTAAQPSHDWASDHPEVDFTVNANGTLALLEATRRHAPEAVFIFTSTNKVYGDAPNRLPLIEQERRWEIDPDHPYATGIREDMSIDQNLHSLFGVSKVAADLLVQEYGRYFNLRTTAFRCGCLTGPNHSGTQLHGFLAYLMKCAVTKQPYSVFGYRGKQVRDNIHSSDLVAAFEEVYRNPGVGQVFNMGGGRQSNCSMLEAIELCEQISGQKMQWSYRDQNRIGDHIWWISDTTRFREQYPSWNLQYDVPGILQDIFNRNVDRWRSS